MIRIKIGRILLIMIAAMLTLCGGLLMVVVISNQNLPATPTDLTQLTVADQARIDEAFHLKKELGNEVWNGWGDASVPVVIWNSEYAFLTGMENPPDGWTQVQGQLLAGSPVYRQLAGERETFTTEIVDGHGQAVWQPSGRWIMG